jgi:hypothetical protein
MFFRTPLSICCVSFRDILERGVLKNNPELDTTNRERDVLKNNSKSDTTNRESCEVF